MRPRLPLLPPFPADGVSPVGERCGERYSPPGSAAVNLQPPMQDASRDFFPGSGRMTSFHERVNISLDDLRRMRRGYSCRRCELISAPRKPSKSRLPVNRSS